MGFGVQKWVKMRQNPLFPTLNPIGDIDKNPFSPTVGGMELCAEKESELVAASRVAAINPRVVANPPAPYSIKKCPEPQILSKICPDDCFSGFQSGGPNFVKNLKRQFPDKFFKILTNLGPPDWIPEKQSSGQILDKFRVQGTFECCKGPEGFATLSKIRTRYRNSVSTPEAIKPSSVLSERGPEGISASTPHIVDTDTIADAVSETSIRWESVGVGAPLSSLTPID